MVSAAPFIHTQGVMNAGHDYVEGVAIVGLEPQSRDVVEVTEIRKHAVQGDFRFASSDGKAKGVVLGKLLAIRLNAYPGDSITLLTLGGAKVNPVMLEVGSIARIALVNSANCRECPRCGRYPNGGSWAESAS